MKTIESTFTALCAEVTSMTPSQAPLPIQSLARISENAVRALNARQLPSQPTKNLILAPGQSAPALTHR